MKIMLESVKLRRWGAWNCAFYAMLAVVGFIGLNVAGCGGGGANPIPTGAPVNFTLQLRDLSGNVLNGTGTVAGGSFRSTFTTTNGNAIVTNVPPGEYAVTVTINGTTITRTIAVARDNNQNIVIIPELANPGTGTTVTGRIFLNAGDPSTGNCSNPTIDQAVTARVLIRARRIADGVIIQSFERPQQPSSTPDAQKGQFLIVLPAGAFRLEVRQASAGTSTSAPAQFTGNSAIFNVPTTTFVTMCVNNSPIGPGGTPTPTVTFTPSATPTRIGAPTATPVPTATPFGTPGPTATPTTTPRATATPTPGGPPPNPTFTPAPTFTPNPNGTPTPTRTQGTFPTATPTGGPPPPPGSRGRKR